ncbi:hypothetical protein VI03_09840 [Burkholderia vietnamiensis]|nr:hypothetical protein VI03_09840 [Burkholderia vietnamiensis]
MCLKALKYNAFGRIISGQSNASHRVLLITIKDTDTRLRQLVFHRELTHHRNYVCGTDRRDLNARKDRLPVGMPCDDFPNPNLS